MQVPAPEIGGRDGTQRGLLFRCVLGVRVRSVRLLSLSHAPGRRRVRTGVLMLLVLMCHRVCSVVGQFRVDRDGLGAHGRCLGGDGAVLGIRHVLLGVQLLSISVDELALEGLQVGGLVHGVFGDVGVAFVDLCVHRLHTIGDLGMLAGTLPIAGIDVLIEKDVLGFRLDEVNVRVHVLIRGHVVTLGGQQTARSAGTLGAAFVQDSGLGHAPRRAAHRGLLTQQQRRHQQQPYCEDQQKGAGHLCS